MNINVSLFGQMITFAIFVWFTMRYVWPPITNALAERKQTIADGLAAAEQGVRSLEVAKLEARETIATAKREAQQIIDDAKKRASNIVDDAKSRAREEGDRQLAQAQLDIARERETTKQALYGEVSDLVVMGIEKLLGKAMDGKMNDALFQSFVKNLEVE